MARTYNAFCKREGGELVVRFQQFPEITGRGSPDAAAIAAAKTSLEDHLEGERLPRPWRPRPGDNATVTLNRRPA